MPRARAATKFVLLSAAAALVAGPARAAPPRSAPLPPPRPKLEAEQPTPPTPTPSAPAAAPTAAPTAAPKPAQPQAKEAAVCAPVRDGRIIGVSLPPITGDGGCGVPSPVRITGVRLRSGATLKLTPDAVLNCDMAGELAGFLDEEIARIEHAGDGKVVEVQHAGAYECRGRNRVAGAKLSEHASGNAIDLRAFRFSDGRAIVVGSDKTATWTGVKGAACARFQTVLGPGSDAEHKDHLHLDMRKRKSMTICQWDLD